MPAPCRLRAVRHVPLAIAFGFGLVLCVTTASAQTSFDEATSLTRQLGLPESTVVSAASVPGLPTANPMRVYLAFGMDMLVRDNFVRWIEKWNNGESKKRGKLVLVDDIGQADLVFARFALRDQKQTRVGTTSRIVPTQTTANTDARVYGGGEFATGSASTTVSGTTVVKESYSYETMPVYAYILAPKPTGLKVLWRYVSDGLAEETSQSGQKLFDDFRRLAKERPSAP